MVDDRVSRAELETVEGQEGDGLTRGLQIPLMEPSSKAALYLLTLRAAYLTASPCHRLPSASFLMSFGFFDIRVTTEGEGA